MLSFCGHFTLMEEKTHSKFQAKKFFKDVLIDILIIVALVLVIRNFLFAPFRVNGSSMCDTFNVYQGECYSGDGEFIFVSRLPLWNFFGWRPDPLERGDVIVFEAPYSEEGTYYIKRVIGLPGDTLLIEDGIVYLQNETGDFLELDEMYLNETNFGNTQVYRSNSMTYTVPEGQFFVMGDNRTQSSDSRRCFQQLGCGANSSPYLSMDRIQGEVQMVLLPLSHFRFISDVDYDML